MDNKQYSTRELFRRFAPYFKKYRFTLWMDLFCAALTTVCELVLPLIMRYITNEGLRDLASLSVKTILSLGVLYFGLRIVDCIASYYMSDMGHVMGAKIETDMRRDAYNHLQKLSNTYYNNTKVGQIMGRITNDLFDVTEFAHHCPEEFFIAGIKTVISFIILANINLPLTLMIFLCVPLIIFFSLFVAMMLNRKMKCRGLVRAIFFLPVLLGAEAVSNALSLAAQMMAGGLSGTSADMAAASASSSTMNMDYLIDLFAQLALPDVVLDYIVGAVSRISDIIQASGVQIVLFIAGLQSIPSSLYEVAKIEGATGYETFWKVTFPMVMPHIITCTIYTIVDAFSKSEVVKLAYSTAFTESRYGLSSAFSVVSTLITCALLGAVVYFIGKRTFYYN